MHRKSASGKILITGAPGVGKTTLIKKLANRLAELRPIGFYTQEIRERGVRVGFTISSLDGKRREAFAHVGFRSPYRVGRYGVDLETLDRSLGTFGAELGSAGLVIIDEIGKMECFSDRFRTLVTGLLASERRVIATVALRGSGFIAEVKNHPSVRLMGVTPVSRDALVEEIAAIIQHPADD